MISPATKFVVLSLEVKVRAIAAVAVEPPEDTAPDVIAIVGAIVSIVTLPESAVVSVAPALPATSV